VESTGEVTRAIAAIVEEVMDIEEDIKMASQMDTQEDMDIEEDIMMTVMTTTDMINGEVTAAIEIVMAIDIIEITGDIGMIDLTTAPPTIVLTSIIEDDRVCQK